MQERIFLYAQNLQVHLAVEPDHLFDRFVRAVKMLVLDIEHWIDPMWLDEQAESILDSKAGKQAALMPRMLPVKVNFRCPPFLRSIFELCRVPKNVFMPLAWPRTASVLISREPSSSM
jgi:hypothetical protein